MDPGSSFDTRSATLQEFKQRLMVFRDSVWVRWCIFALSVCSVFAFCFHELHGLLFDRLDALRGAVLLLILQVALEEELDLLHGNAEVDRPIEDGPAEGEERRTKWNPNARVVQTRLFECFRTEDIQVWRNAFQCPQKNQNNQHSYSNNLNLGDHVEVE